MGGVDPTTAVLAHGLLNTVHAVTSVPPLLRESTEDEAAPLCEVLVRQLAFLRDAIDELDDDVRASLLDAVREAGWAGERVAEACARGELDRAAGLLGLLTRTAARITEILQNVVRGLAPEVIAYLDSLDARET